MINYYGADNPEKIHGRSRDILWINEAHQFPSETIDQLFPRTRYRIIADYNPALGLEHWLDQYIEKYPPLITTYKDNPYLTQSQIDDIEGRKHNAYWWSVYGKGERSNREGVIFENWEVGGFKENLPYIYGQDFGFYPDPTTLIRVAVDKREKVIYLDECFTNNNRLTTQNIFDINLAHIKRRNDLIIADSAEPRLISEVKAKGLNIQGASKGSGSVLLGITQMSFYKIVITDRSKNLKKELSNYVWSDKRAGLPIDKYNHCFIGDTLITTIEGQKKIKYINAQDYVLTSNGYRKVLKKFNNGIKEINKYTLLFDTFSLYLSCTKDHKIKTNEGWKPISELSKDVIFLHTNSIIKNKSFVPINVNHNLGETKDLIILKKNVNHVQRNLLQTNIVRLKLVGVCVERIKSEKVYDLMIDGNHEYFANGVLVHNCIDSARYAFMKLTAKEIFNHSHGFDNLV